MIQRFRCSFSKLKLPLISIVCTVRSSRTCTQAPLKHVTWNIEVKSTQFEGSLSIRQTSLCDYTVQVISDITCSFGGEKQQEKLAQNLFGKDF